MGLDSHALAEFLRRAEAAGRCELVLLGPDGDSLLEASVGKESESEITETVEAFAADLARGSWHRFTLRASASGSLGSSTHTIRVRGRSEEKDAESGEAPKGREMAAAINSLTKCVEKLVASTTSFNERMLEVEASRRAEIDAVFRELREQGSEVAMTRLHYEHEEKKLRDWVSVAGKAIDKVPDILPLLLGAKDRKKPAAHEDTGDADKLDSLRKSFTAEEWQAIEKAFGADVALAFQQLSTPRDVAELVIDWPQEALPKLVAIIGQQKVALLAVILEPQLRYLHAERAKESKAKS